MREKRIQKEQGYSLEETNEKGIDEDIDKYFKNENFLPESIEKMLILCGVEMKYQKYFKDDTIFKIGEQPKYFYIILSDFFLLC